MLESGTIVKRGEQICIINHTYKDWYIIRYWLNSIDDQWLGAERIYSRLEFKQEDITEIYQAGTAEYQAFNLRALEIARGANSQVGDLLGKDKDILYPCGDQFASHIDKAMNHIHDFWLVKNLPRIVREQDVRYDTPED